LRPHHLNHTYSIKVLRPRAVVQPCGADELKSFGQLWVISEIILKLLALPPVYHRILEIAVEKLHSYFLKVDSMRAIHRSEVFRDNSRFSKISPATKLELINDSFIVLASQT
jgi:hypothetical protein